MYGLKYTKVCTLSDLPDDEGLKVVEGDTAVAVFNVNGKVLATQDRCSHAKWSLSEGGYLDGDVIVCSLHMGKFCAHTGAVKMAPPWKPLKKYPVKVEGEDVFVAFEDGYFEAEQSKSKVMDG